MAIYRNISLLATGVNISPIPGRISFIDAHNNSAAAKFVKLYDKAIAPTVGTDVPVWTLQLTAAQHVSVPLTGKDGAGLLLFKNGIGIGGTTLVADADATAPAANDIIVNIIYS